MSYDQHITMYMDDNHIEWKNKNTKQNVTEQTTILPFGLSIYMFTDSRCIILHTDKHSRISEYIYNNNVCTLF